MKRTPINRVSKRRQRANTIRKRVLEDKFGPREGWKCALAGQYLACFGNLNGHELLKRSRGGSITDPDNIEILCDGHNVWVEDHPTLAHEIGMAKHSWEQ